jgi:hypothetical protein
MRRLGLVSCSIFTPLISRLFFCPQAVGDQTESEVTWAKSFLDLLFPGKKSSDILNCFPTIDRRVWIPLGLRVINLVFDRFPGR